MEKTIITAYLLAGGKSSRMGSDKGLTILNGKPIAQHVLDTLQQIFPNIVIITSNEDYARFGFPLISDEIPDKGPIGGIYTALQHCNEEACFIISCDLPFVSEKLIRQLLAEHQNEDMTCVQIGEVRQPLCGIYHTRIKSELEQRIMQGKLKVMDIFTVTNHNVVHSDDTEAKELANINTPDELKKWTK